MRFGQLLEYNMENIFLEKSYTKCGKETIPRPFTKFVLFVRQVEGYQYTLRLSCRPLSFSSYKSCLKNKWGLELVSLPHLLHDFWRKIFLLLYSINWANFIVWWPLLRQINRVICVFLGNMCLVIVCNRVLTSIKPFFLYD